MAKWIASIATWTPVATADTVAFTQSSVPAFHGLGRATGEYRTEILEVYMGGQSTSSSPMYMVLARDSLSGVSTTPTFGTNGKTAPLEPHTNVLVSAISFSSSVPVAAQRSATAGLLNLTFNAFGGIVRWVAPPGSEIKMFGSSQPFNEVSLSGFTSTDPFPAKIGSHIIYEAF